MPPKNFGGGLVGSKHHATSTPPSTFSRAPSPPGSRRKVAWDDLTSQIPAASRTTSPSSSVRRVRVRKPPTVFERYEERQLVSEQQAQAARVTRQEQSRIFQRRLNYRNADILTQQDDHPVLYPADHADVLAARSQYVGHTLDEGETPNIRLLTQIDAEISAMSGNMTTDDVYFLSYDLNKSQPVDGRPEYNSARRRFVRILQDIRDLPRKRREAAQEQSNRIRFQAVMKLSNAYHGGPGNRYKVIPW